MNFNRRCSPMVTMAQSQTQSEFAVNDWNKLDIFQVQLTPLFKKSGQGSESGMCSSP